MIFIGGTGRSGTTILSKILNQHEKVYSLPQEIRFITDPDGLISLKHALVSDWSKFHADFAMGRFIVLMENLKNKYIGNYPNHNLSKIVSNEFYYTWIEELKKDLINFEIRSGWAGRVNIFQKIIIKIFGKNQFTQSILKKSYYCSPLSEKEFNEYFGNFTMQFLKQAAILNNANITIDHTPSNILHFKFISDMIPEAKLIHIYRDPRDVACSYKTKDWASNNFDQNILWIKNVLTKWNQLKLQIDNSSFLEIKFESIINDTNNELKRICDFLTIDYNTSLLKLDISNHNIGRWKSELDSNEIKIIENHLSSIIDDYGYPR